MLFANLGNSLARCKSIIAKIAVAAREIRRTLRELRRVLLLVLLILAVVAVIVIVVFVDDPTQLIIIALREIGRWWG